MLDRPSVWEASRAALDLAFGLYRRRRRLLSDWGVLDGSPSLLDIGCGIGQYSSLTTGRYVGVDLNCPYVDHAAKRRGRPGREFRCTDATALVAEGERFDLVLMVDFLHHLADGACGDVLGVAAALAQRHVIALEPIREQPNPAGRWFIENDRGDHMRPLAGVHALFEAAPLRIERSERLMLGPIETRAILAAPSA